ncbi:hypothetical protein [Streptomyces canus]|uniref:hypothetical protein n=1 Tax=Streptomyces canus TaxID=58343 RepID=UPI0027806DF3|nr:hypothetical protein [Streptomyces canus]MDQ0766459.1 hypothetical protein [Streptomyces canus]MDQ1065438.1 hypothetical protein [Streptomyces canus]
MKDGIAHTLRALHHGERQLARDLLAVAERHAEEHEVHHVATDLADWSREHADRLAEHAAGEGLRLDDDTPEPRSGEGPEGLLLLHDLRALHLAATENSLHWEMLAQAAQATRDARLLELASACHPQTLRQTRWTDTLIKQVSPQVLTSL